LISLTHAACDGATERSTEGEGAAGVERETTESDSEWKAFKATAEYDLDVSMRKMESVRASLAESERAEIDHWTSRVKSIREEMSKEYAESSESRERYRERIKREARAMVDEAKVLLSKLTSGMIPSKENEPSG